MDTLIIGAGAAGLAAARSLYDVGQHILILEARDRIGGRAWTDTTSAEFPVELGAEFIHGEGALTHELVRAAGLHTIPVVRMDNLWWASDAQPARPRPQLPLPIQQLIDGLLADYHHLPDHAPASDMSLADYLRRRGWDADAMQAADVLLAQTCCSSIENLSCFDLIRESRVDHAGTQEFRIREGYAALFDWYSRDLPLQLNTPVREIRWSREGVTVVAKGEIFSARRCIITIPVNLLAMGAIRFDPPLSQEKIAAIGAFNTQPATKLIYQFRQPLWDESLTFMAHTGLAARWWTPGYGRAGAAVIGCFITADRAQQMDAMDESEALSLGLDELAGLLGLSTDNLHRDCRSARRISWAADPFAFGGYAHVPPGASDNRPLLAQPQGDVLFFAGEATAYDTNPQTVHGALESGIRAAREYLDS